MKKFLLGAAAALAIAAPGVASAQSGYVDLGYQSSEADVLGVSGEADGFTAGGAVAWGELGSVGVQLDGLVGRFEADEGGGDTETYNVGGHIFTRDGGHLIGGFANFGNVEGDAGAEFDYWTVGAEGAVYVDRTTFNGALSYSEGDDVESSMTALDLGVTHFFTDNLSLGGNAGFGNIDTAVGDADAVSYGVSAEWQLAAAPISIFGGWQHAEIDDIDSEADTLGVGVRYNFGGTLLERDRTGASLSRGGGLGRFGGLL